MGGATAARLLALEGGEEEEELAMVREQERGFMDHGCPRSMGCMCGDSV
jgi:hypothetical protein